MRQAIADMPIKMLQANGDLDERGLGEFPEESTALEVDGVVQQMTENARPPSVKVRQWLQHMQKMSHNSSSSSDNLGPRSSPVQAGCSNRFLPDPLLSYSEDSWILKYHQSEHATNYSYPHSDSSVIKSSDLHSLSICESEERSGMLGVSDAFEYGDSSNYFGEIPPHDQTFGISESFLCLQLKENCKIQRINGEHKKITSKIKIVCHNEASKLTLAKVARSEPAISDTPMLQVSSARPKVDSGDAFAHADSCDYFGEISPHDQTSGNPESFLCLQLKENCKDKRINGAKLKIVAQNEASKLTLAKVARSEPAMSHTPMLQVSSARPKVESDASISLDRPYRVFLAGGLPLPMDDIVVNKYIMASVLNESVMKVIEESNAIDLSTRLQAYMWPIISGGQNIISIGELASGKSLGYILPLASLLLDMWPCVEQQAYARVGGVAVVVCKSWRAVQCVGDTFAQIFTRHKIRVVTAWGGLGPDSLNEVLKDVYRGCDVLVSTLPFLMRIIGLAGEEKESVQFDLLGTCFHLVLDDADVMMDTRAEDVKLLLKEWALRRSESNHSHFCQQLIVTSSSWTKYIHDLTEYIFPLMTPTLIISSHLEAAKAAQVRSILHVTNISSVTSKSLQILGDVANLVKEEVDEQKRVMVFVKNNQEACQLKKLFDSNAAFSMVVHGRMLLWQQDEAVKMWKSFSSGNILIATSRAVPILLQRDVRDANVIIHADIPQRKEEFVQRFSFLMDNYRVHFDATAESPPVSLVMLDDCPAALPSYLLGCLEHLGTNISPSLRSKFSQVEKRGVPLCHYLKAYGSCPSVKLCLWRHEIVGEDLMCKLPESGIATLELVKILNASRYLMRLTEYRESSSSISVDLSRNHLTLFMTLQRFCDDESRLQKLEFPVAAGNLCLINRESVWARARVLHVGNSKSSKVDVFLLDEGDEISVKISDLYELPSEFTSLPQLILEIYLCNVQPFDKDKDWTHNANIYIEKLFAESQERSKWTGCIKASLSHTLWLSPLVEIVTDEGTRIRKESIRSQLIRLEYGSANTEHAEFIEKIKLTKLNNENSAVSWLEYWTPKSITQGKE